ncbi:MAG: hypothetical protein AB7N76_23060 [Planctomycetota bacterium]
MYTYLSDRLFVAITKRLGVPRRQLRRLRGLQRKRRREGVQASLFTTARLSGFISEQEAQVLLDCARRVASERPEYRRDVLQAVDYQGGMQAVEVSAQWVPDTLAQPEELGSSEDLVDLLSGLPASSTSDAVIFDLQAEPRQRTARRKGRRRDAVSDDLLRAVDPVGESFARHLESQVDAFDSGAERSSPLGIEESGGIDALIDLLQANAPAYAPPPPRPAALQPAPKPTAVKPAHALAEDSSLFEIDWDTGPQAPIDWLGDDEGYDPFGPPLGRGFRS